MLTSCRRMVAVVARAWNGEASAPAARVRLNAIAASTSQAPLALNRPEGRWASGPFLRSAMTCSMIAWRRWSASACSITRGELVNTAWWCQAGNSSLALCVRDDVSRVLVTDAAHDQPCGHRLFLAVGGERCGRHFSDLGVADPLAELVVEGGVRVADRGPRILTDRGACSVQGGVLSGGDGAPGLRPADRSDVVAAVERRVVADHEQPGSRGRRGWS